MTKNKSKIEVVEVNVNELQFFEGNPKKFSSKQFGKLKQTIKKEGLLQPLTVNKKTMTVLDGNQRLKVVMSLGDKSVPVIFVDVSKKKEAELVAYFNETKMPIDPEAMALMLSKITGNEIIDGFKQEYEALVKSQETGMKPEYEIVKEVDESYNYTVFTFKKGVDFLNIQTFFNLQRVFDPHKNRLLGVGRVIDGDKLIKLIDIARREGAVNIDEVE